MQEGDAAETRLALTLVLLVTALAMLARLTRFAGLMLTRLMFARFPGLMFAGLVLARLLFTRLMLTSLMLTLLAVALLALALLGFAALQLFAVLVLALDIAIAVGPGLLLAVRLALLWSLLAVALGAVAPTLIVAVDKAAHGLDHAVVVIRVLPVGLRHDAVAGGSRLACQRLVLVEDLMGIAAHPDVRTAAVEYLVPIGRAVRIMATAVMLLVMLMAAAAATAATTAAATRPLPIVWSH